MVRSIVSGSIRFRLLVLTLAAAILVLGFVQLPKASVDALPEFAPPFVEVQTEALGLSAEEVEQLITVPLEADLLNGVQDVDGDPFRVDARTLADRHGVRSRDELCTRPVPGSRRS